MLLASLELEREPLTLESIFQGGGLEGWVQIVGGIAGFCVLIFILARACGWRAPTEKTPPVWMPFFWLVSATMLLVYVAAAAIALYASGKESIPTWMPFALRLSVTLGGALGLLAATMDFWVSAVRLRWRRIWALALLSIKEAIRGKILYVFGFLLIVVLFATWFMPYKPSDQLKNYVAIVFFVLPLLVLVSSGLVSAFSIPNDIRNQNIHTIVTKPVERFEIVLGRFLGYTVLMSVVLFVLTTLSLGYVLRGVNNPEAAAESLKARQPVYGTLTYEVTNEQGVTRPLNPENVGREWDYRSYISGPMRGRPMQYAVWSFDAPPKKLGERNKVKLEFYLDVYRTTKGEENRGVNCTFLFETWRASGRPGTGQEYAHDERLFQPGKIDELVEELGYFEVQSKPIFDYRTLDLEVPGALFRSHNITRPELQALQAKRKERLADLKRQLQSVLDEMAPLLARQERAALAGATGAALASDLIDRELAPERLAPAANDTLEALQLTRAKLDRDIAIAEEKVKNAADDDNKLAEWEKEGKPRPPLRVRVRCNTPNQYVGMAKYDLYFREDAAGPTDTLGFSLNFYKGALGVWLELVLVVGLSVFFSTELGGIISALCAAMLYFGGIPRVRDTIEEIAGGKNVSGGPLESAYRIVNRGNISAPLEDTTTTTVATRSDSVFRWLIRMVLYVLPDIGRFDFSEHVGKGFDITLFSQDLFPAFLMLLGYLFPWAVVSYYLIKIREIAGAPVEAPTMATSFQQQSLYRKIIYLGAVVVLLTVALVWRKGVVEAKAAELAVREEDVGDVEVVGEVARHTLPGLRGVATCFLWMGAIEAQKKNKWNELELLVRAVTKLQPHFITPWQFQSWNLAYNVSVESDQPKEKYFYVSRGIQLLAEGERLNRNDPNLRRDMGFYHQHKICKSDENNVMRSLYNLSLIPPRERDPANFRKPNGEADKEKLARFCREHPHLARRLHSPPLPYDPKREYPKFVCATPEELLQFLEDSRNLPSLYAERLEDETRYSAGQLKENPRDRFPVLPPPRNPVRDASVWGAWTEDNATKVLTDETDAYYVAGAWYNYAQECVPDPGAIPGKPEPISDSDRTRKRIPRGMSIVIFRTAPARAQTFIAERLQEEGWFDGEGFRLDKWFTDNELSRWFGADGTIGGGRSWWGDAWGQAHKAWQRFGRNNLLWFESPTKKDNKETLAKQFAEEFRLGQGEVPQLQPDQLTAAQRERFDAYLFLREYQTYRDLTNFNHFLVVADIEGQPKTVQARKLFYEAEQLRLARAEHVQALKKYEDPRALAAWRQLLEDERNEEFRQDSQVQDQSMEIQLKYLDLYMSQRKQRLQQELALQLSLGQSGAMPAPLGADWLVLTLHERSALQPTPEVSGPFDGNVKGKGTPLISDGVRRSVMERRR